MAHTPSDHESTSHKQKSTSTRPAPRTTSTAPPTSKSDAINCLESPAPKAASRTKGRSLKEHMASRKQQADARKLDTPETEKNVNGKRPLKDEEKVVDDAALPQKKPKGAAAGKHVASLEKTAPKTSWATARVPDAFIKAQAAIDAASKAPVKAATKKPGAPTNASPPPQAPDSLTRFKLTSKEDRIKPAARSEESIAKEKQEVRKRSFAATEMEKNQQVNPKLLAASAAERDAKKALESHAPRALLKALGTI